MERLFSALRDIKSINRAYDINTDEIEAIETMISQAKVCTPVIGKFSSGKSALINSVLGYSRKILKEDITPETAVPAEIVHTDKEEKVEIVKSDALVQQIELEEYRGYEADAKTVKCAKIYLRNQFLSEIPDVMLVDMPGFESGFEIHNRAIDDYLPNSLAYIVAFPADDMIVRSSVGNILKELCLNDMPLCVVITKYDKRNDEFEITLKKMQESMRRFVGDRQIHYCKTSSFDGDSEELKEFLTEIQEKSQEILYAKYVKEVLNVIETTENYLVTRLNSSRLSASELDEKEDQIQKQIEGMNSRFSDDQNSFETDIRKCINIIKNDVQCAMEAEISTFTAMIMNNQNINAQLNTVVRNAVTASVKKNLLPKIEHYVKKASDNINNDLAGDIHVPLNIDYNGMNKNISNTVVAVTSFLLLGPIMGVITAVLLKVRDEKKREEAKMQIRSRLQNDIFPQVLNEVSHNLEIEVTKQVKLINTSIKEQINNQNVILSKAMEDVRNEKNLEQSRKENLEIDINQDLERIKEIKNGL